MLPSHRRETRSAQDWTEYDPDEGYPPPGPSPGRRTVSVERYRKGPVGWIAAILFWSWQALCLLWLWALVSTDGLNSVTVTMTLFVWLTGTLPLAIFRYVTRGKKIITTTAR